MEKQKIKSVIIEMIADAADLEIGDLTMEENLYSDTGMDSLGAVGLVVEIQRTFGVIIPEEIIPKLQTADAYINYVTENIS